MTPFDLPAIFARAAAHRGWLAALIAGAVFLGSLSPVTAGACPSPMDSDSDGLTDCDEVDVYGTDPFDPDTDGDGLSDGDEVLVYGTNPLEGDTDFDGLDDGYELFVVGTSPIDPDTDGDGLNDGDEVLVYFTDPFEDDTDGDGLDDLYEVSHSCLDPLVIDDIGDPDLDGLETWQEFLLGTDPCLPDTDSDGLDDLYEVTHFCLDPLVDDLFDDPDGDGLETWQEVLLGTNPCLSDTDGDGLLDGVDNCPTGSNSDQANSDGRLGNGPFLSGDDNTRPNGPDGLGDACDPDMDNDGRLDTEELAGIGCGGAITEVSDDISYSDGDPPSWDSDGDSVLDGVECALGTDPSVNSSTHRTLCFATYGMADADGDGLPAAWELCKWGTSDLALDSDGDAPGDCREVMDTSGNGAHTNADAVLVKQVVFALFTGDLASMDINGNGLITNADATIIAQAVFGAGMFYRETGPSKCYL
jgi:hypothetical protein